MNPVDFLKQNVELVARHYDETSDQLTLVPETIRVLAKKLAGIVFGLANQKYYIKFVKSKPYSFTSVDELLQDAERGFIQVSTLDNTSDLFGPHYNLLFRAGHDALHATLKRGFSYQEEVEVWNYTDFLLRSGALSPELVKYKETLGKILRSEIVYQAAYKEWFGKFYIGQKIILSSPKELECENTK